MNLEALQAAAKAHYDALKAENPYPGGWRYRTKPTLLEQEFARHKRVALLTEPLTPTAIAWDFSFRHLPGFPGLPWKNEKMTMVVAGRLYVRRRWILTCLTKDWTDGALHIFLVQRPNIRRIKPSANLSYYDVEDVVAEISVMGKSRLGMQIAPSVARVLQGAGSINDKLLAFVENGAQ